MRTRLPASYLRSRCQSDFGESIYATIIRNLISDWIAYRRTISASIRTVAVASFGFYGGCSEGAVPGLDGGDWLESSSAAETQDSDDTLIPTTQGDSGDLPSIEDSSDSDSASIDSEDSSEGTTTGPESTSTEDPEGTESDTEDPESTSSTSSSESETSSDSGSDEGETGSSDSDSQESAEESDSTSSSSSSESTESSDTSTSESSSDDTDSNTSDNSEDEGTESTGDSELDCDKFIDLEYRAVNAKYTGWTPLVSSVPAEQIVLQPADSEGTVDFTIKIPCRDKWYIWIRAYDEFEDDSFRLRVDGSPGQPSEFEVDCNPTGNQYRWTRLHFKKANSPPCEREQDPWVQQWDSGDHHLIVYPLNAPVLSRIMVSNNPDFVPR